METELIIVWSISILTLLTYSLFLPYFYLMGLKYADMLFPNFEQKFKRHQTKLLLTFYLIYAAVFQVKFVINLPVSLSYLNENYDCPDSF